jgi:hypothetical protein
MMNPLYEHLNDELERQDSSFWSAHTSPDLLQAAMPALNGDQEVKGLVAVARRIQMASAVQVDPDFAERLEQRMLVHNAMQRLQPPQHSWWSRLFPRSLMRAHPVFAVTLSGCLLVVLLAIGVLMASSQVTNPNNPLYAVNQWEQNVRISLSRSPTDRAQLDLQFAGDRLSTLIDLANPSNAQAYEQQLEELGQQIENTVQSIDQIPAGAQRDQLKSRLATFETQARHVLRSLLPRLTLEERLATTDTLADLGDSVPHLSDVQFILLSHSSGQATIIISGSNLEPGAQVVINGRVMGASGSLQNGVYTFRVNWNSKQQAHSIGILNPDDTFAQTTMIGLSDSGGNGNGNGNGHGNGKGNGNSCGNGNGNGCGNGNGNGNGNGGGKGNGNGGGNGNGNGNSGGHGNGNGKGGGNGNGNNCGKGNGNSCGNGNHGK